MATRLSDLEAPPVGADELVADKVLVLAFQNGSSEAYAEIFERYRSLTERICFRILGNREDAEEAVQETMLRVLRGLPRFNGRYQLQAWIARIATNVSVDMLRARGRKPQNHVGLHDLGEELLSDGALDPEEQIEVIFEQERVRSTLDEIPPHHRDALMLREFEGRSHEEIGDALGVSPAQAKALIHRAKGTFRRAWGEDRRGLAALLPWYLLPSLFRKVGNVAESVATRATAAPAVAEATVSTAEKVTAAAVAVVVAGTVGVGAIAVKHAHRAPASPVAATSPASSVSPAPALAIHPAVPARARSRQPVKVNHHHHRQVVVPPPVPVPSSGGSPSPSPSPSPGGGGTGDPSPTPSPPPVGPPPDWGISFSTDAPWGSGCGYCPASRLISSSITGIAGGSLSLAQVMDGSVVDGSGSGLGEFSLEYWGSAEGETGSLGYDFKLDGPQGWVTYSTSSAVLSDLSQEDNGGYLYTFTGGYQLVDGDGAGMPQEGSIQIQLRFWPDGTLYQTEVQLFEKA